MSDQRLTEYDVQMAESEHNTVSPNRWIPRLVAEVRQLWEELKARPVVPEPATPPAAASEGQAPVQVPEAEQ